MSYFVSIYFGFQLLIVIIALIGTFLYRHRRLQQYKFQPPFGFQKTNEIFIDPTTGVKQQVWFNPNSGERFYQEIDNNKG
jgi:flagellar biogenesis protein FliO